MNQPSSTRLSGRAVRRIQSLSLPSLGQKPLPLDVWRPLPALVQRGHGGTDAWSMQVQCLLECTAGNALRGGE